METIKFGQGIFSKLALAAATLAFCGCAYQGHSLVDPENHNNTFYGMTKQPGVHFTQQSVPSDVFSVQLNCDERETFAAPVNFRVDRRMQLPTQPLNMMSMNDAIENDAVPLSPGDMIEVLIENGDGFSGRYIVDNNGYINLPLLPPVDAAGHPPFHVAQQIEMSLIKKEIFQPSTAMVSIQVLHWAGIEVGVSGAVFKPGRVLINGKGPAGISKDKLDAYGDFANTRLLSEALRAASGIRPDAKLEQVILIRKGWQIEVDMTGVLTGDPVADYPLIAGDRVIVPSTGCFQPHLVRLSQITPTGFRVFMSNLIDSANSNAQAAVGKYSSSFPYGARLLQAAVSANCVGGKEWTNAPRKVLLASQHPITGETQVIERSVEQLMRMSHRDDVNPFLMPNDAIACYDSSVTNIRDIAGTVLDILAPLKFL